jgi:uncharacterized protein (DUF2235 family)
VEFYSRVIKDDNQLTYYDSGIGTYVKTSAKFSRMWQRLYNFVDMAVALLVTKYHSEFLMLIFDVPRSGFKGGAQRAYKFLCDEWRPGDRIYLFGIFFTRIAGNSINLHVTIGFSRGAYQVRVIAGMIEKVEVLHVILIC